MQAHLIISETIMALSINNAGREVDGATRVVDGSNRADDARFFEWLQAQLALSNSMEAQEGQGSNDITPEGSIIINNPESEESNNITVTSDHHMVEFHTIVLFLFPFQIILKSCDSTTHPEIVSQSPEGHACN